jgi:hypothetical protein
MAELHCPSCIVKRDTQHHQRRHRPHHPPELRELCWYFHHTPSSSFVLRARATLYRKGFLPFQCRQFYAGSAFEINRCMASGYNVNAKNWIAPSETVDDIQQGITRAMPWALCSANKCRCSPSTLTSAQRPSASMNELWHTARYGGEGNEVGGIEKVTS